MYKYCKNSKLNPIILHNILYSRYLKINETQNNISITTCLK